MKLKKVLLCIFSTLLMITSVACESNADTETSPETSSETSEIQVESAAPEELLTAYMAAINAHDYEEMYSYISENSGISEEDFIARNKNIYEGIEAENIEITIEGNEDNIVRYTTTMDTQAGQLSFPNQAQFTQYDDGYRLEWSSNLIFPNLSSDDKVRVETTTAERGSIYDRNGVLLMGTSDVYSVGFVPGVINAETRDEDIATVAEILNMTVEEINSKLSESWVADDLFVPLKNISYSDTETKEALLEIKGIMLNTTQDRVYTLGEKAAHLTGYINSITQDELEEHEGEGYTEESKIGKAGLESLYEEQLKGTDGCRIYIVDENGEEKETLVEQEACDGEDVTVTIDASIQEELYDNMQDDTGAAVVMDSETGEILALVSTPSYDPNDFILGLSEETWAVYNDEETLPMYNRFKATYTPGSAFKPIVAALGLSAGAFTADEDFGASGTSWQKDDSWNQYYITTLKEYSGAANLQNALVYSDNIYFAKVALKIGSSTFAESLKNIGFGEDVPFEFGLTASTFGTDLAFADSIDVANSGFGQGNVLVNPIFMASVYSAFVNDGDMLTPYLDMSKSPSIWKENIFTAEAVEAVKNAMIQVIEDPDGTGYSFKIDGLTVAGKTGTAEIKDSKEDTEGTETGWFIAYTADETAEKQYVVVAVIEGVQDKGGSHYVIPIVRSIFID